MIDAAVRLRTQCQILQMELLFRSWGNGLFFHGTRLYYGNGFEEKRNDVLKRGWDCVNARVEGTEISPDFQVDRCRRNQP